MGASGLDQQLQKKIREKLDEGADSYYNLMKTDMYHGGNEIIEAANTNHLVVPLESGAGAVQQRPQGTTDVGRGRRGGICESKKAGCKVKRVRRLLLKADDEEKNYIRSFTHQTLRRCCG